MKITRHITALVFWLALTHSAAQCSFDAALFEGKLTVAKTDSTGFPTVLATPEDELSELFIDCEAGSRATLRISQPLRLKDGGPVLKSKPSSFFIYQNQRYENKDSIIVTGEFSDRSLRVGMMIGDEQYPLPASDGYKYAVTVTMISDVTAEQ